MEIEHLFFRARNLEDTIVPQASDRDSRMTLLKKRIAATDAKLEEMKAARKAAQKASRQRTSKRKLIVNGKQCWQARRSFGE